MSNLSPAVILYNADGVAMSVSNGVAIPVGTNALIIAGSDGTNSRFVRTAADGTVRTDPTGTTAQPVSGTFWQATQPVSAAALPLPSGAATSALQTQPGTDIGDVTVNNGAGAGAVPIQDGGNSITVDGTFWQATQPVSAASLPLPAGAATSLIQTDGTQKTQVTSLPALPTGTNTIGKVDQGLGGASAWKVDGSAVTQPVSAATLPLPTGAATSALQTQPGVDIGDVTVNNAAGAAAVNIQDGGNSITVDGIVAVTGLSVHPISAFTPDPANYVDTTTNVPLAVDPAGNLITRGQVLTDEGSFRDDFGGTSLLKAKTGTIAVTNGNIAVVGTGTFFTTELSTNSYIRLNAHANSALTRVATIIDDTNLELEVGYAGATGSSAFSAANWGIDVSGTGANHTVGSSLLNLISGTANAATARITRSGDYLPFTMTAALAVSARIVNQKTVVGFEDNGLASTQFVRFEFDGTDATKVKCRSAHDSDSVQETLIVLPGGVLSSAQNVYRIEQSVDRSVFRVNDVQVASHQTHIPDPYKVMNQVAYVVNSAAVASTTVAIDAVLFFDHDDLDISEPLAVQGTVGGTPISIQFGNPGGGTALPKLINVTFSKSEGAVVANVYKRIATYTVPAAYNGYLIKYVSFQGEAATSRVVAETNMGSHNDNTNVFTAGAIYTQPQWAPLVQAEVTTAFASGSGNVVLTVGYTNELGTAGRSGTITIPKGSALLSRWDLVLQGTDLGVTSIQSVTGTPAQVGVAKLLGFIQLAVHQDQSTTTQTETLYAPGAITFPPLTVLGLEYAGGTVAKARFLDALIQLVQ